MPSPTPGFITLKEVLNIHASGELFDISFVTANKSTGGGGQWRHYQNCTCPQIIRATPAKATAEPTQKEVAHMVKNPNHFENSTRNVKLPDGSIKTVHLRLIRQLNGRVVL